MSKHLTILIILAGSLLSGCVALNSHQTGRTLGEGNYSLKSSYSLGSLDQPYTMDIFQNGDFHILEVGFAKGVRERLDIGISVNSAFHFEANTKYQLFGNRNSFFASSIGFETGMGPIGLTQGLISYGASTSIYNSFHITDWFALTVSPRYIFFGFSNIANENGNDAYHNIYGYSAGIILA